MSTTHTPVQWAQRGDKVFLTLCVDDCKNPDIKLEPNKLHFTGVGGHEHRQFECDIEFFAEVDPDTSKYAVRDRNIEFVLFKKDTTASYWPRLIKEKQKIHWIKVDFAKWKDEDESDNENDVDLNDMMRNMGGLDGGDSNFGNMMGGNDLSDDSDDEDLPDLEGNPVADGEGEGEEDGEEKGEGKPSPTPAAEAAPTTETKPTPSDTPAATTNGEVPTTEPTTNA